MKVWARNGLKNRNGLKKKGDKSEYVVVTAAKLLKTAIREASYQMDSYPSCEDVQDPLRAKNWPPKLLQTV